MFRDMQVHFCTLYCTLQEPEQLMVKVQYAASNGGERY